MDFIIVILVLFIVAFGPTLVKKVYISISLSGLLIFLIFATFYVSNNLQFYEHSRKEIITNNLEIGNQIFYFEKPVKVLYINYTKKYCFMNYDEIIVIDDSGKILMQSHNGENFKKIKTN